MTIEDPFARASLHPKMGSVRGTGLAVPMPKVVGVERWISLQAIKSGREIHQQLLNS